jgi:hypothetical protein
LNFKKKLRLRGSELPLSQDRLKFTTTEIQLEIKDIIDKSEGAMVAI